MSDLISRQAAIDEAIAYIEEWNNAKSEYHKKEIIRRFQNLPSAQPETCAYWDRESNICALHRPSARSEWKRGRWIDIDDHVMCSCCGATHYGADKNFCPNCGCAMKGEDDE